MWTIGETDKVELALDWYNAFPKWLRFDEEKDDETFLTELKESYNFLGSNGKPQAFVQAQQVGDKIYEGHLYCDRSTDINLAVATIAYAKSCLFNDNIADTIVAMVNVKHKTLQNIILRAGFYSTGLFMWKGVSERGRIIETEQFIVKR